MRKHQRPPVPTHAEATKHLVKMNLPSHILPRMPHTNVLKPIYLRRMMLMSHYSPLQPITSVIQIFDDGRVHSTLPVDTGCIPSLLNCIHVPSLASFPCVLSPSHCIGGCSRVSSPIAPQIPPRSRCPSKWWTRRTTSGSSGDRGGRKYKIRDLGCTHSPPVNSFQPVGHSHIVMSHSDNEMTHNGYQQHDTHGGPLHFQIKGAIG